MSIPVPVLADATGAAFSDYVRLMVGNIAVAIMGIGALRHLVAREATGFFEWAALAILVGIFIWVPSAPQHIAQTIGGFFT